MNTIAEIKKNEEKNGIEIYFRVYPLSGTKETMKKYGFRWNRKKSCWYAKCSLDAEYIAGTIADTTMREYQSIARQNGEEIREIGEKKPTATRKATTAKPETINLDDLGKNAPHLHGAELAKAIREDLKKRGVKGVTVRARRITYDTGITVTVKASAADFVSIEEAKERYTFSHFSCDADRGFYDGEKWVYNFHELSEEEKTRGYEKYIAYSIKKIDSVNHYRLDNRNRGNFWELKTEFYNRLCAIYKIANQWNYDNSDSMTDYFDVGYYLDIDIKQPEDFEIRETMTDTERKAYDEEMAQREAEKQAQLRAYEEEQTRQREAEKKYNEWLVGAMDRIEKNITVQDLPESEQIYIDNLDMGCGKECSIDELKEYISEHIKDKHDALVTRVVTFTDKEAYNDYCKLFLHDFEWIAGKGGTASEDVRLDKVKNIYTLTEEQRESVKFYCNDCIAVYLNDTLSLVLDPQGYDYARYVMLPSDDTTIYKAAGVLKEQREASEKKEPFYFPAKVEEQAANIHVGQEITVYQCDGWILNSIYGGFGTVKRVYPGDYAQYTGVYIDLIQGKKKKTVFIRDNKKILIYEGIMPPLPESVTEEKISDNMSLLHNEDVLFKKAYRYYKDKGILPIVDTWQR